MPSLHLTHAEIQPRSNEPIMINGQPVKYSRVLWMGGAMSVPNPNDFKGVCTDVFIEVDVKPAPKAFTEKGSSSTTLSIQNLISAKGITSAKVAK